jgi:hypothetical protein
VFSFHVEYAFFWISVCVPREKCSEHQENVHYHLSYIVPECHQYISYPIEAGLSHLLSLARNQRGLATSIGLCLFLKSLKSSVPIIETVPDLQSQNL